MSTNRCPDCFHRLRVDEEQEPEDVLMFHQMSGDCPATTRIIPARDKKKKPRSKRAAKEVALWVSPEDFELDT